MKIDHKIKTMWLIDSNGQALSRVLVEYRYFVHRFTQWFAMVIGRAEDQHVRQLLLPNLVDELGGPDKAPSHLDLLDRCLSSCGIRQRDVNRLLPSTREAEAWFYEVCSNRNTHTSLCVLGPGTESISQSFLAPLEKAIKRVFSEKHLDLVYFDVHRPEVESAHADSIDKAIRIVESNAPPQKRKSLAAQRARWTAAAVRHHAQFWNSMRSNSTRLS